MVVLKRGLLVALVAYAREAERSVHRLLNPANSWAAFQGYYDLSKKAALARILQGLRAENHCLTSGVSAEPWVSRWQTMVGYVIARWSGTRRLALHHVQYLDRVFCMFLAMLEQNEKPAAANLIALRMEFCSCQHIIYSYCPAWPELVQASKVAHFDATPGLPNLSTGEFLSKVA